MTEPPEFVDTVDATYANSIATWHREKEQS